MLNLPVWDEDVPSPNTSLNNLSQTSSRRRTLQSSSILGSFNLLSKAGDTSAPSSPNKTSFYSSNTNNKTNNNDVVDGVESLNSLSSNNNGSSEGGMGRNYIEENEKAYNNSNINNNTGSSSINYAGDEAFWKKVGYFFVCVSAFGMC